MGLVVGFAEVAFLAVQKFYLGRIVRFGPDAAWLTPLASAVVFLVPGLVLALGLRHRDARGRWLTSIAVLAFLAYVSLLLLYYFLHPVAKVLLAAGLALQTARLAGRWRGGVDRMVGRSWPWLAALVAALAVGVRASDGISTGQSVPQTLEPSSSRPNVLLVVWDTVRAANLSLYGYHRDTTPNLDRWAKTGVIFDRATSTSPWTLPSHASLFTGRWAHELSANWEDPLDGRYPTLAELLSRQGYFTAAVVANTHYCGHEFGVGRGFASYEDYVPSPGEFLIASSLARAVVRSPWVRHAIGYYDSIPRRTASTVTRRILERLDQAGGRPFFAFVNYFDAHEPYLPPAPFRERFGPDLPRGNEHLIHDLRRSFRQDWTNRPASEIATEVDMYDGAIAYLDHELGRLLSELDARGVLDNTIVIVTSDHGEQFGEHGLFVHANSLYAPLLHVPLVISYPARLAGGGRIGGRVSLRDVPATIMDLAGLPDPGPFPGTSLVGEQTGGIRPPAAPVLSEVRFADWAQPSYPTAKGDMHSLIDNGHHYIRNGDGREELYALDLDPAERHDLSADREHRSLLEQLRTTLAEALRQPNP
jgi:arylsulfatase A-like enzyme